MNGLGVTRRRPQRPAGLVLEVEAGQVMCPRGGPIDLEHCFACSAYRGFQDGPIERLVCASDPLRDFPMFDARL